MTLYSLFRDLSATQSFYNVYMSYFEIYNEQIFDLLSGPATRKSPLKKSQHFGKNNINSQNKLGESKSLELRTDANNRTLIPDLSEIECKGWKDALKVFQQGESQRSFSSTEMNHNSSRSHVVFQIRVDLRMYKNNLVRKNPRILLVDLAGSESTRRINVDSKQKKQESGNINKSLLALTRVIKMLNKVFNIIPLIKGALKSKD